MEACSRKIPAAVCSTPAGVPVPAGDEPGSSLSAALGINFPTSQWYIDRLVSLGILCETTGVYQADEILNAFTKTILQEPMP